MSSFVGQSGGRRALTANERTSLFYYPNITSSVSIETCRSGCRQRPPTTLMCFQSIESRHTRAHTHFLRRFLSGLPSVRWTSCLRAFEEPHSGGGSDGDMTTAETAGARKYRRSRLDINHQNSSAVGIFNVTGVGRSH